MKPVVHILATVRRPALMPAATFVFKTLRVGFPTADVYVWGNGLDSAAASRLEPIAAARGCQFRNGPPTSHDRWIETLIEDNSRPFWICDTDVVFWDSVEAWPMTGPYAGRFEPAFHDEWTDTVHVERLHTCLMHLQPALVRAAMREWTYRIPEPWRNLVEYPFIRQNIIPRNGRLPLFYDSTAGLYHALPGHPFTHEQNEAFDHLGCATYADAVDLSVDLASAHAAAYEDYRVVKGRCKPQQEAYYNRRKLKGNDAL